MRNRRLRLEGGALWRRTLAALIDATLCVVIAALPFALGGFSLGVYTPPPDRFLPDHLLELVAFNPSFMLPPPLWLLAVVVFWHLGWLMLTRNKQTLGLMLMRLKLVNRYGDPPTLAACAVRALGHILAGVSLGLGWLWLYITPDRRSWPDLISRTVVVRA